MELSPDTELVFQKSQTHQNPRQTLTITNNTKESFLAFKVKTTAPKLFVVRPNSGKLAFGEKIDITIVLQLRDGSIDTKRKDKFLVQSIKLPPDVASLDENSFQAKVGELWNLAEQSKKTAGEIGTDVILEKKIKCIYALEDLVAPSTTSAVTGDSSSAVSNNRSSKIVPQNEVSVERRSVFEDVDSMNMKTPGNHAWTCYVLFNAFENRFHSSRDTCCRCKCKCCRPGQGFERTTRFEGKNHFPSVSV
jgi:hypothetical protein